MGIRFRNSRKAVQAEATEWILQLDEQALDQPMRHQLLGWLRCSPVHVEEFLIASAIWHELDGVDATRKSNVEELLALANDNVISLDCDLDDGQYNVGENNVDNFQGDFPKKSRLGVLSGLAASLLAVAFIGYVLSGTKIEQYQTGVGQQSLFTLDDGSIVHLNTQSSLSIHFTENFRQLNLAKGEAMFEVAEDPSRPFRVTSGTVVVEAIGTQFNIHRLDESVQISVIEGEVSVEPSIFMNDSGSAGKSVNLTAGEEAQSTRSGSVALIDLPDIEKSTAWRQQRLVFRNDSLATVAAEFNRYNREKIDIERLAVKKITATFDAHDPESFIAFLERDPTLIVIRADEFTQVTSADQE